MTRRTTATLTLLLALLAAPLGAAWADEGDSPAEQAFRAGWWAETSEGKLDRALEHYREAVTAEGPASVKARAYYRMGVVLHRIGRTQEAIQSLERLAKEHPTEEALQTKAKARLEEWTAVDLETDFDEWYRRYQYSPEFQARIVELVLSLSANTEGNLAATSELLTIGAPAIPALKAHLDSSNELLRGRVVDLLMKLGEVPDADALHTTHDWRRTHENWALLLGAPDARKQALLAALQGREGEEAQILRAVLGPKDGWAEAYRLDQSSSVLNAILEQDPSEAAIEGLKALVGSYDDQRFTANQVLARALVVAGHVSQVELVGWLSGDSWRVAQLVAQRIASWEPVPEGVLEAVIDCMRRTPSKHQIQSALFEALIHALGDAPTEAQVREVVKTLERVWPGHRISLLSTVAVSTGHGPTQLRSGRIVNLLEAIVGQAKDPQLVRKAMDRWSEAKRDDPLAARQFLAWTAAPLDPENQNRAALWAGSSASAETIDEVLKAVRTMEPATAEAVWRGLEGHRTLQGLPWGDKRFLELLAAAEQSRGKGSKVWSRVERFIQKLLSEQHRVEQVVRLALQVPWRVPAFVMSLAPFDIRSSTRIQAMVRDGFPSAWHDGDLKAKRALLRVLEPMTRRLDEGANLDGFFRQQLRAVWGVQGTPEATQLQREVKALLLHRLPRIELADVRAAVDLEDPDSAAAVATYGKLPATAEMYDALARAREAKEEFRLRFWNRFQGTDDGALKRRVHRDMTEDPAPDLRGNAVDWLGNTRNAKDLDVLRRALKDEDVDVRRTAANAMSKVYDRSAIQALVQALEDEDPGVRDAVLHALDVIKAIEQKKEYWRKAVGADGTMPSDD